MDKKLEVVKEQKFLKPEQLAYMNENMNKRERCVETQKNMTLLYENTQLKKQILELQGKLLEKDCVSIGVERKKIGELLMTIDAERKARLEKIAAELGLVTPINGYNPDTGEISY